MKQFVFWTGIYNVLGGTGFVLGIWSLVGVKFPQDSFWSWGFGSVLIYTGIALVLCSRDLPARAALVVWEGVLRIVGFFLFVGYGFLGDFGFLTGVLGVVELIFGLVYLLGLPKSLNTSAINLLLDRSA